MAQDQTKKEALFNEVKGSLFEYLVGRELSVRSKEELAFQKSLDANYLTVLSQQDRMVRQFYPEMLPFLSQASKKTADKIIEYLGSIPRHPKLVGKFSHSSSGLELNEADLLLFHEEKTLPVSLKLNKKNAFVNTKSGGIKSFFTQYFPFLDPGTQEKFNKSIDLEFHRMACELHAARDMDYDGSFDLWTGQGLSELPGELEPDLRAILKSYYARIAKSMHGILQNALEQHPEEFKKALQPLMGFSSEDILQVIYFHDFPVNQNPLIDIHSYSEMSDALGSLCINSFGEISSVEIEAHNWNLQIRVKPMNKFTTTAIKINCSVKVRRPSTF